MALKHVLLGVGVVAAVGAGYLAYRYATSAPAAHTTTTPMVEVKRAAQETGDAIQSLPPNNHFDAGKPQATAY